MNRREGPGPDRLRDKDFAPASREAPEVKEPLGPPPRGYFWDVMARFSGRRPAAALVILACIAVMAVLGPLMNPFGYNEQMLQWVNLPPRMPALAGIGLCDGTRVLYGRQAEYLEDTNRYPPGSIRAVIRRYTEMGAAMCDVRVDAYALAGVPEDVSFWFGTDYLGRDLWTRTWRGARFSLTIALIAVTVSVMLGTAYGAVAGYFGGRTDMVMMRISEIAGAFPQSIVAVLLILLLGTGPHAIILALVLRGWTGTARLTRGQFLRLREQEYVLAARTLGSSDRRLIFRHLLPNALGPVVTRATMEIPGAIFSEAFLAFIGLGIQAPKASLGILLSDAQQTLMVYPYQMIFPGVIISLLLIAFNMLGNSLREALDPR